MWEKRVYCFENRLSEVKKKQSIRKNTPKNQKELNGIETIYIPVVVVLIFTPFLIILFFILLYFFTLDFFSYARAYR